MSSRYTEVYNWVGVARDNGMEPDKVVIPGGDWRETKSDAEVREGEGYMGGDLTQINGVRIVYDDVLSDPVAKFNIGDSE